MAGGKSGSANPKQTEKAGRFAPVDFMKFMQKNAVAAPREQRLKNEVRGNVVIRQFISASYELTVAPHAGAWIETMTAEQRAELVRSPPTRGRGLKLFLAPRPRCKASRPPRGGVD